MLINKSFYEVENTHLFWAAKILHGSSVINENPFDYTQNSLRSRTKLKVNSTDN